MTQILKPPAPLMLSEAEHCVFLAGSIDMGQAEPWQATIEHLLRDAGLIILNPRRDDWDASWEQHITNSKFREQVEWELNAQDRANLIAFYFSPTSYAPITLLELGLFARSGKLVVCCPDGFWRKGNVDIVCARYDIPQVPDLAALAHYTISFFQQHT